MPVELAVVIVRILAVIGIAEGLVLETDLLLCRERKGPDAGTARPETVYGVFGNCMLAVLRSDVYHRLTAAQCFLQHREQDPGGFPHPCGSLDEQRCSRRHSLLDGGDQFPLAGPGRVER